MDHAYKAGFVDIVALLGGDATDPALDQRKPYTEIITDSENVDKYLRCHGIDHDRVWIPESKDLEGLHDILATHLREKAESQNRSYLPRAHILANLRRYNRQYSGFVMEGRKYIICAMDTVHAFPNNVPDNRFAEIGDGWWSVVRVIFDAEKRTVVHIECNGQA